ncbi:plexin-C1 [Tiliqua scincoides]|uniref:plexin-C1 n=1 Tax=Tiliqua scincoides TaxID=71010 RepID=UPI003461CE43
MPGLALLLLLLLGLAAARPRKQTFNATVANLAVSRGRLWVASGRCVYGLEPSLGGPPLETLCGNRSDAINKLLLPFREDRLLTCWTQPQGSCYQWHLGCANLTCECLGEQLVTSLPQGSAAGHLYSSDSHWYLVVATSHILSSATKVDSDVLVAISIKDKNSNVGELQYWALVENTFLYFVDALLWSHHFFFPYHHYNRTLVPAMAVISRPDLDNQKGIYHGQTFLPCANGTHILSSSLLQLSQERAFWVGVFQVNTARSPTSSALCIFDLARVLDNAKDCYLEDLKVPDGQKGGCKNSTLPIKSPSLRHSDLVSVYATVVLEKIVLFLGTGNGQLMKVVLDENMEPSCPEILYEIEEEPVIFHKLALDPVDKDYIYLPSDREVRRILVANCSKYISCKDCLSAMDPHCGWCSSNTRCTLAKECLHSNQWANISYGTDKCLKVNVDRGEISVTTVGNFSGLSDQRSVCKVINTKTNKVLCENETLDFTDCSCDLNGADLTKNVQILFISGSLNLSDIFDLNHCSIYKTCSECDRSGCTWNARKNKCVSSAAICKKKANCGPVISASDGKDAVLTQKTLNITSIEPAWISTLGKSEVIIRGQNLTTSDIWLEVAGASSCEPDDIRAMDVNGTHMKFCLPPSRKEAKSVCVKAKGFKCSSPLTLYYVSLPMCFEITPSISWISGGRNVTIRGKHLNVTDRVIISNEQGINLTNFTCHQDQAECVFTSPLVTSEKGTPVANITLEIEKKNIHCINLQYQPDPKFIRFELTNDLGTELELKIHKEKDRLNISTNELVVYLSYKDDVNGTNTNFTVHNITNTAAHSIIQCRARWKMKSTTSKIDKSMVKVYVKVGNKIHEVPNDSLSSFLYILFLIPAVIAVSFAVAVFVTKRQSTQLDRKLSEHLELLECGLRKDIRDGFVELQMEKLDVVDNFGTIPFLDYKHFVLRAFFPESGAFSSVFIEDTSEPLSRNSGRNDESITALYTLICNKNFLVTLIHTLEKQKNFCIKDRCFFASYLTIALQTNLVYLTHILEVLTKDLMDQSSNTQPKLLLRRTESVVEKLLTNWMSVCLSGFLRETVGEPFYLLVTTLNQRISRGPVDVVSSKALYTLNEDWLLWQVPEFSPVALNVIFEKIPESEGEDATQSMVVEVLDCDTIGQAKEKILQAFLSKNGSFYGLQLTEMGLALQSDAETKELQDTDSSTIILEDGTMKLNTIGHYKILDGATVKVFRKKTILPDCSDEEYSDKYCHLILPDSEAANVTQGTKHKRKQKFKVKEMYLTKLLSTKIAVHSVVEKLFRSIWTLPNNKAPVAIKYFFDFLDAQAENKKITDPDVVHIWKTNSLPLRFWVNILKNPQFVFDMKKTLHIDGCLSVIAQAFMDAFSLSEQLLGKEAPTNKLLYVNDIPLYKEEVKAFYKAIKDLPSLSASELEEFLTQESKKHENEFNKAAALTKIYQYISRYFDEILNKLEKERGLEEAQRLLLNAKALVDEKKKCKWNATEDPQP